MLSGRGIGKRFGPTLALDDVSFDARPGEVTALLGENGAGKSTLLSIIAGLVRADVGTIELEGAPLDSSKDIAIVPQEPTFAMSMTVAENITLGREPTRLGLVDVARARTRSNDALRRIGATLDPDRLLQSLAPAERQLVAIARALDRGSPRVVILDEPTSSLTHAESSRVLQATRELAKSGAVVLYVSHHLEEVRAVADHLVVLRAGKCVHQGGLREQSVEDLAELLVGRAVRRAEMTTRKPGALLLSVETLEGPTLLRSASFELRRGEVLGVAGLVASGRTELVRAIMGLDQVRSGAVRIGGVTLTSASPSALLAQRVGMISEDRKGEGLLLAMSVADNITITKLPGPLGGMWVSAGAQRRATETFLKRLAIRAASAEVGVSSLSGGNQQKVAIARLLFHDVDVFLLDEPTRGIDPESRESIYQLFDELAAAGKAVLWISSQLEELTRVCDRVAFMSRGTLSAAEVFGTHDDASLLARVSS